ncbi:hypothetical protein ACS0PU_000075 [Formica fusca]
MDISQEINVLIRQSFSLSLSLSLFLSCDYIILLIKKIAAEILGRIENTLELHDKMKKHEGNMSKKKNEQPWLHNTYWQRCCALSVKTKNRKNRLSSMELISNILRF